MNTSKNTTALSILLSGLLVFNSSAVMAHDEENQCNLSLNNDLSVTPEHIRIIEDDETLVDIYQDNILFIKGEQMNLNDEQQKMIVEYSTSIRKALPEVTKIAVDAVGLAFEGLNIGLGELVDMDEHEEKFKQLQQKINDKYQDNEGSYSVTKGDFNIEIDDEEIDVLVEDLVEGIVPSLIGGLISGIGQAIASGNDIDIELDDIGEKVEREIEAKAELIEIRADAFCNQMKSLDKLEQKLINSNSDFKDLDLLEIEH
ncbi:hypothetical protein GCM10008107_25180 [Psychrosphaera saromensis]|uniref:DUF2884 domain-containing protein n=1 Tax=Psychrosphaera saromensis TaxID=716813 RepID=A0A2S7UX00_9GAMM|nr:DUF2884 family protein [Psychrosphaera saromensis]PQJ54268.1 hypothetical protein BTO11_11785 [Psychrosphaera saromensis]GHB74661.1 hypothetical protein GCM10008107_25180 [Psychrosphaera saromensis]GLQ12631.1 hypothetical protein GCM10007917_00860 [Psychrosphaera saromensis]